LWPALIVLVSAHAGTLSRLGARLSSKGPLVAAASSFPPARQLLRAVSPDLLIADIRLAAYNGLHLSILSRVDHPHLPVIITPRHAV
jgi:DNA-binding NtrC family response regulator